MENRRLICVAVILWAVAWSGAWSGAAAKSGDFYLLGRMGVTQFDVGFAGETPVEFVGNSTAVALEAGYRFLPYLAVQGGYENFGEVTVSNFASMKPTGWSLCLMAQTPKLLIVRFYGKIGAVYWQAPVDIGSLGGQDYSGTAPIVGGGIRIKFFPKLEAILEYETFEMDPGGDLTVDLAQRVQTVSVGLGITF